MVMSLESQVAKLIKDVNRLKIAVKISDNDWRSVKPALQAMGIDYGVDWAKKKLRRAEYASDNKIPCDLVKGKHYSYDGHSWSLNVNSDTTYQLLNAKLPDMPDTYAA